MRSNSYYEFLRTAPFRLLVPNLLGLSLVLLPGHSIGQAANSCNLIPNPDFELQNVVQMSGAADNVLSTNARYNELASWKHSGYTTPSNAQPTYYATNAPTGSASNPFTNNPALNVIGPHHFLGSSFTPYNYDQDPAVHNGAISIITARSGTSSPLYTQDYISPTSPINLTAGKYYASFQAYRAPTGGATRVGMRLESSSGSVQMQSGGDLLNSTWTRVSQQITIPAASAWNVTIGNIEMNPDRPTRARYHIDEVELYKIPTAGPSVVCSGSGVRIGEGCPIPGATYEWSRDGSPDIISTSLNPSVNITGSYTLKVKLPDQSFATSTVSVTGCNPPPAFTGDETVCAGANPSFTANNSSVIWTASPATLFSSTNGYGQTFTPGLVAGASGQGTIKATFYNLTGAPSITRTVTILPAVSGYISGEAYLNTSFYRVVNTLDLVPLDAPMKLTANALPGTTFAWSVVSPDLTPGYLAPYNYWIDTYNGQQPNEFYIRPSAPRQIYSALDFDIQCIMSNPCESVPVHFYFRSYTEGEVYNPIPPRGVGPDKALATVYPNPVSDRLTLPEGASNATLLNNHGEAVRRQNPSGSLDVQRLPAGLYNLRMQLDGKFVNQRIEVKH
jgi:hypothetical protein